MMRLIGFIAAQSLAMGYLGCVPHSVGVVVGSCGMLMVLSAVLFKERDSIDRRTLAGLLALGACAFVGLIHGDSEILYLFLNLLISAIYFVAICTGRIAWSGLSVFVAPLFVAAEYLGGSVLISISDAYSMWTSGCASSITGFEHRVNGDYFGVVPCLQWCFIVAGAIQRTQLHRCAAFLIMLTLWAIANHASAAVLHYGVYAFEEHVKIYTEAPNSRINRGLLLSFIPVFQMAVFTIAYNLFSRFVRRGTGEGSVVAENNNGSVAIKYGARLIGVALLAFIVSVVASKVLIRGDMAIAGHDYIFLNSKFSSYDLPTARLGHKYGGMFGIWRSEIERSHKTRDVKSLDLNDLPIDCSQTVLVLVNPEPGSFDADVVIEAMSLRGLSVLVLTDHTDLSGRPNPLNGFDDIGLTCNFDSAFPVAGGWENKYYPSLFIGDVLDDKRDNVVFQHSTGCSFDVSWLWTRVLVARHCFGDIGNELNDKNAFLGDYSYQHGESLSGLPVVVGRQVGKGRILAFGDTSAFQNIGIRHSAGFIRWASAVLHGQYMPLPYLFHIGLLVALTVLTLAVLAVFRARVLGFVMTAMGSMIIASLTVCWTTSIAVADSNKTRNNNSVIIAASYSGGITLRHWRDRSIDGLWTVIYRSTSLLPVYYRGSSVDEMMDAAGQSGLIVMIDPIKHIDENDQNALVEWIDNGGSVVVSIGPKGYKANGAICEFLGFTVGDEPLGPVPVRGRVSLAEMAKSRSHPQFSEAWKANFSKEYRVVYEDSGNTIVAIRPFGKGQVSVIVDPMFLLDRSLESEEDAWPGNHALLNKVLPAGIGGK